MTLVTWIVTAVAILCGLVALATVDRDVVSHYHHPNIQSLGTGLFGGDTKVQSVACIILDNKKAPARTRHAADSVKHGLHGRARKDAATDRPGEHALADKSGVGRFMTRATTAQDSNLACVANSRGEVSAQQNGMIAETDKVWVRKERALDHVLDGDRRVCDEGHSVCVV